MGFGKAAAAVIVLLLALAGVLSACGDDTVDVPSGVLGPDVVGGTPYDDFFQHMGTANSCGLDSIELFGGTTTQNTIAYRRTIDGHHEYLVIGAYKRAPVNTRLALKELAEGIASKLCNTPPYTAARLHLDSTPSAFAFKASSHGTRFDHDSHSEKPWHSNILRSYTYLQQNFDDTMVLVSIERTDGTTPPTSELEDLTAKQVAKTKATLAAKA